jgi:hypothetical protein
VAKKSRFSVAAGRARWVYNPNTLLMRQPKIAEDPQFYVDNVDTMTPICYEDPYKQREMLLMLLKSPRIHQVF